MIPNIVEGADMPGLLRYLVGPGRANEHTSQHLVAGDPYVMAKWGSWSQLSVAQASEIARVLDGHMRRTGTQPTGRCRQFNEETGMMESHGVVANHVWHCSLSLSPEEPELSDEVWARIAQRFMDEMGLTGADGKSACMWAAVRHGKTKAGGDHIHIAANVVRADGTVWSRWQDQRRAQRISGQLEEEFGLRVVESRLHARGARADSAGARNLAERRGQAYTDRQILEHRLRVAASASLSEEEFVGRVRELGVRIRPRFAAGSSTIVTGYSVGLHARAGQRTVWHGASKIARDLALPVLRARWNTHGHNTREAALVAWRAAGQGMPTPVPRFFDNDWVRASHDVKRVVERFAGIDASDDVALADACADTAGLLSACASAYHKQNPYIAARFYRASQAIGRCAQLHHRGEDQRVRNMEVITAARLLTTAANSGTTGQELALIGDILRLGATLIALHRTVGQVNTAAAMLRDTTAAWDVLHRSISLDDYVERLNVYQKLSDASVIPPVQNTSAPQDTRPAPSTIERRRRLLAAGLGPAGTPSQALAASLRTRTPVAIKPVRQQDDQSHHTL